MEMRVNSSSDVMRKSFRIVVRPTHLSNWLAPQPFSLSENEQTAPHTRHTLLARCPLRGVQFANHTHKYKQSECVCVRVVAEVRPCSGSQRHTELVTFPAAIQSDWKHFHSHNGTAQMCQNHIQNDYILRIIKTHFVYLFFFSFEHRASWRQLIRKSRRKFAADCHQLWAAFPPQFIWIWLLSLIKWKVCSIQAPPPPQNNH